MGTCSEDPHPCWASRLLGLISLFLSEWLRLLGREGHGTEPTKQGPDLLEGCLGFDVKKGEQFCYDFSNAVHLL